MATAKETIKQWLRTKKKPTQAQFWAWLESYWHKDEQIPVSQIQGLDGLLGDSVSVEAFNALVERVQTLEDAPRTGVQNAASITLVANEAQRYTLPKNAVLFGIEVQGTAAVKFGSTESEVGNLGSLTSDSVGIVQFGLSTINKVWIEADTDVTVVPIIYVK